jgi:hypothetical protein
VATISAKAGAAGPAIGSATLAILARQTSFAPGSSLSTYVTTIDRLLAMLPRDTRLYGAHCCRNDAPPQAPWLSASDLEDTRAAIKRIQSGDLEGRGFIVRRFPVNDRMTMLTLYPIANR